MDRQPFTGIADLPDRFSRRPEALRARIRCYPSTFKPGRIRFGVRPMS